MWLTVRVWVGENNFPISVGDGQSNLVLALILNYSVVQNYAVKVLAQSVWRSTLLKIHCAGTGRPCWFPSFLRAMTVSSIATVCPGLPSCCGWVSRSAEQMSPRKLDQSTAVLLFTFSCRRITS